MTAPQSRVIIFRLVQACSLPLLCHPVPLVKEKDRKWLGWLPKACHQQTALGFTLAELLISLGVLGVIATFTIPKILSAQQDQRFNAIEHEAAATISSAYQRAQLDGVVDSNFGIYTLFNYINYVKVDTTSTVDGAQTQGSISCADHPCVLISNGAILYASSAIFGGISSTNVLHLLVDPDGTYSGTTNGPGKSVDFYLYYNGKLTTAGYVLPGSANCCYSYSANPSLDPPWFQW